MREDHSRARQPVRHIHGRHDEVAHDQVEGLFGENFGEPAAAWPRSVFTDRIRQWVEHVCESVGIKPPRTLRRVSTRHCDNALSRRMHAVDVGPRLIGIDKTQIGNLMPPREMTHQMPRAQLAAFVKRQQQIRLQPQYPHGVASALLRGR